MTRLAHHMDDFRALLREFDTLAKLDGMLDARRGVPFTAEEQREVALRRAELGKGEAERAKR